MLKDILDFFTAPQQKRPQQPKPQQRTLPTWYITVQEPKPCDEPLPINNKDKIADYKSCPILDVSKGVSKNEIIFHTKTFISWYYQFDFSDIDEEDTFIAIEKRYYARFDGVPVEEAIYRAIAPGISDRGVTLLTVVLDLPASMGINIDNMDEFKLVDSFDNNNITVKDFVTICCNALQRERLLVAEDNLN